MNLDREIKDRRAEVHSDGYAMSIGELVNLYRDGEIDIHPEFQRFYRWTPEQKSQLIESILLGIPLPSIFVSQRDDGIWDVVDGLQRLSTVFELMGELKDENDNYLPPLELRRTKYLPSLEGTQWETNNSHKGSGRANQLIIRRSKIDVKIILRESSEATKYELFQRLNTGGSQLSDQELRNAIIIIVNPDGYRWISDLARYRNFQLCIPLTNRLKSQQYDLELVTRFLIFRTLRQQELTRIQDLNEFLTDKITDLVQSKNFKGIAQTEGKAFKATFDLLSYSLGENSFRKFDQERDSHMGPFLISAFEPIAMGLGYNFKRYIDENSSNTAKIEGIIKGLWNNANFLNNSGSGVSSSTRIRSNIPLGRKIFGV